MRTLIIYCLLLLSSLIATGQEVSGLLRQADNARRSGQYDKAISIYDGLIASVSTSTDTTLLFDCLSARAHCHKMLSNYNLALSDYNKALSLPAGISNKQSLLLNKSDLLLQMGQFKQAEELLEGLTINDGAKESVRINNLAAALIQQQKNDEACDLLGKIIDNTANDDELLATALQNRGFAYMELPGHARDAVCDLQAAVSLLSGARQYIARANLAAAQSLNGQYDEALINIDQVLIWQKRNLGTTHPDYIISIRKKAEILLLMDKKREAEQWFKMYYKAERDFVLRNFTIMTEQQRIDFWKKEKPLIGEMFSLETDCPEFLLDVALFRREVALLGAQDTARNMMKRLSVTGHNVRRALRGNEVAIDFVRYTKRNSATGMSDNYYGALVVHPATTKKAVEFVNLWSETELNSIRLANGKILHDAVRSSDRNDKDCIYTDSILADRIWKPLLSHIAHGSKVFFAPDGLLHILAIEYLPCESLKNKRIELSRVSTVSRLMERSGKSKPNVQFLVVGGLNYNQIDKSDLNEKRNSNHDAADYLSKHINNWNFPHLSATGDEVDSIGRIMLGAKVTFKQTEDDLKVDMSRYRWVHLSTHGYALQVDEPPLTQMMCDSVTFDWSLLASGIAFSGANVAHKFVGIEDGIISAREFCDMDLHKVEFVAMSACQTALGQTSDEGPAGLLRGLKKAGVGTVMASLWEVNDRGTQLLMEQFYRGVADGLSKSKALVAAQQWLRRLDVPIPVFNEATLTEEILPPDDPDYRTEKIYNAPYYWAPFILVDDIE